MYNSVIKKKRKRKLYCGKTNGKKTSVGNFADWRNAKKEKKITYDRQDFLEK